MTKEEYAKMAFEECCSEETAIPCGTKYGKPFWNVESTQFMYVPAFHFNMIPGCKKYRYDAEDEKGMIHSFVAEDCYSRLTPIWSEIPEGLVKLRVTALNDDGTEYGPAGARTFFRLASFPGDGPKKACSYKECAEKAYRFAMKQDFIQSWLKNAVPDPYYDLNLYPSKMISSLILAMLSFARISPKDKSDAIKVAVNAADYLLSITPRGDDPLANLPPTYQFDFCPDPDTYGIKTPNWTNAMNHKGTLMMIYPAYVGIAYLELKEATGNRKYLDEALLIANYYKKTVLESGTWYLVRSVETGEPVSPNLISPMGKVVNFFLELYKKTDDEAWKVLADNAVGYVMKTQLPTYNWEGQFEDSVLSVNYSNLTHFSADNLAMYLANNKADDPKSLEIAKELMRYSEDQFVIWKRAYPWSYRSFYDTSLYHTPAGLEQYNWYVPIDSSTAIILNGFLSLYKAGCGKLWLAKARTLADQLTLMQEESGRILTHWMNSPDCKEDYQFWYNCMFASCRILEAMSAYENVEL